LLKKIEILVLFAMLFGGCDLFGLRDVEAPTESRSHFDPPVTPYVVISNLIYAINEKDINNYINCFVDTAYTSKWFVYTADISSQIQYPIFLNWTLSNEKTYFNNLLSLTGNNFSYLGLSEENMVEYSDSAVYDADYSLRFDHQKTNVATVLNGKLRFILVINSKNLWSISRWIDFKSADTDTTWSVLKANFSN
jgi:hypothetical protein